MTFTYLFLLLLQVNTVLQTPEFIPFKSQFEMAQQARDTLEMARAWYKEGVALQDSSQFEKSNLALQEAFRLVAGQGNHLMMGKVQNFIAINLGELGQRDKSKEVSYNAFQNFMLAGDSTLAANVKINIGMDLVNAGDFEGALKIEMEALELRLQCGDSTNLASYYQHIGEVYKELGIRDKWKESLNVANRLAANPKYTRFVTKISILNDYGGIYEAEKQYDEAVKIYTEMYELSKKEGYAKGMATALSNLSPVYRNIGQNNKALECVKGALLIHQTNENIYGQICAYNNLGRVLLALEQIDQANMNFMIGLKLATSHEYSSEKMESLDGLYLIARQKGLWKDALLYHEQWCTMEDSLQNIDLQEKLTNIETKYQTEKKEQQIELLNSDNHLKDSKLKFQQLAIWAGSLLFLIVAAFTFLGVRQKRKQQIAKQNELEQKLLRSQMNPHFIFNSLGAIQNFMMKNDGRKAAFYLSSFSSLMRSILKNSREELITLKEEKQTLENYLNLQQLRLGNKLSFIVNISDDLVLEDIFIPPMLIQPFVENSIVHAIEEHEGNGKLSVNFIQENHQLFITVEDNGGGLENPVLQKKEGHTSYALQIFKERVDNLMKTQGIEIFYQIDYKHKFDEMQTGTLVTVSLPLKYSS